MRTPVDEVDPLIEETEQPKRPRKASKTSVQPALRKIGELAAQALEANRRENHRLQKDFERLRAVLHIYAGPMLEMLKKVPMEERDKQFLREKGFLRERKGKV